MKREAFKDFINNATEINDAQAHRIWEKYKNNPSAYNTVISAIEGKQPSFMKMDTMTPAERINLVKALESNPTAANRLNNLWQVYNDVSGTATGGTYLDYMRLGKGKTQAEREADIKSGYGEGNWGKAYPGYFKKLQAVNEGSREMPGEGELAITRAVDAASIPGRGLATVIESTLPGGSEGDFGRMSYQDDPNQGFFESLGSSTLRDPGLIPSLLTGLALPRLAVNVLSTAGKTGAARIARSAARKGLEGAAEGLVSGGANAIATDNETSLATDPLLGGVLGGLSGTGAGFKLGSMAKKSGLSEDVLSSGYIPFTGKNQFTQTPMVSKWTISESGLKKDIGKAVEQGPEAMLDMKLGGPRRVAPEDVTGELDYIAKTSGLDRARSKSILGDIPEENQGTFKASLTEKVKAGAKSQDWVKSGGAVDPVATGNRLKSTIESEYAAGRLRDSKGNIISPEQLNKMRSDIDAAIKTILKTPGATVDVGATGKWTSYYDLQRALRDLIKKNPDIADALKNSPLTDIPGTVDWKPGLGYVDNSAGFPPETASAMEKNQFIDAMQAKIPEANLGYTSQILREKYPWYSDAARFINKPEAVGYSGGVRDLATSWIPGYAGSFLTQYGTRIAPYGIRPQIGRTEDQEQ